MFLSQRCAKGRFFREQILINTHTNNIFFQLVTQQMLVCDLRRVLVRKEIHLLQKFSRLTRRLPLQQENLLRAKVVIHTSSGRTL